jgi:hypothetical protein
MVVIELDLGLESFLDLNPSLLMVVDLFLSYMFSKFFNSYLLLM